MDKTPSTSLFFKVIPSRDADSRKFWSILFIVINPKEIADINKEKLKKDVRQGPTFSPHYEEVEN